MILADGFLGVVLLGVWIFCVIDVITTPESDMRNLPKIVWLLLVLLLPDIGSLVWLVAGRQWGPKSSGGLRFGAAPPPRSAFPEYDRPGRAAAQSPDDDAAFLLALRERAEQQRRRHTAQRSEELARENERLYRRGDLDGPTA